MKRFFIFFFALCVIAWGAISFTFAHPGNTSDDGCHYCWTNCASWWYTYGTRHCHNGWVPQFGVADPLYYGNSTVSYAVPTVAASYSDEFVAAYTYAYKIGITTQTSIDKADMYGTLLRSHMAKMMVAYVKWVLGKTPDNSLSCDFTDISGQNTELQWYIKQACQLGLMGIWINAFNPNGKVTQAEFGTILSRALYGNKYDGGTPYYQNHLQALKIAGIATDISTPTNAQIRWYVMIMLQRAGSDTIDNYGYGN